MLVSFLPPVRKEIPHEPGEWIEFRKLGNGLVTIARKTIDAEGRRGIRDFGGEIFKVITDRNSTQDEREEVVKRAKRLERLSEYDITQFDRNVILCGAPNPNDPGRPWLGAIANWSYVDAEGHAIAPTADQIQSSLDEATAAWAHQVAIDMIRPPSKEDDKSRTLGLAPGAAGGHVGADGVAAFAGVRGLSGDGADAGALGA